MNKVAHQVDQKCIQVDIYHTSDECCREKGPCEDVNVFSQEIGIFLSTNRPHINNYLVQKDEDCNVDAHSLLTPDIINHAPCREAPFYLTADDAHLEHEVGKDDPYQGTQPPPYDEHDQLRFFIHERLHHTRRHLELEEGHGHERGSS